MRGCISPRMKHGLFLALLLTASAPAIAGASNFTLVNGTGAGLDELSIRRSGTTEWKSLGQAPSAGARTSPRRGGSATPNRPLV